MHLFSCKFRNFVYFSNNYVWLKKFYQKLLIAVPVDILLEIWQNLEKELIVQRKKFVMHLFSSKFRNFVYFSNIYVWLEKFYPKMIDRTASS